jgi:hypothetical protein
MSKDDNDNEGELQLINYHLPIWIYCILWFLILLAIVCSVGSWAFVYRYRNKPIVAMGQPPFMYTLCFGSMLLPIALALYLGVQLSDDDKKNGLFPIGMVENFFCHIMMWLNYGGHLVIYSALLCKIYRIMKITEQPLRRGLRILPIHALWPLVVVLLLTIGLLITWSTINPSNKYIFGEFFDTDIASGYCEIVTIAGLVSASLAYLYALQALILIVQLILTILAWKIRNLNQELGDSKRIFKLVLFQFICHAIVTADIVFFHLMQNITIVKSVFCLQFLMYSFSTIGFMILPRLYYVWYEYRYGHLPEYVVMIGGGTTTVRGTTAVITGNNINININTVDDDAVNNNGNNDKVIEIVSSEPPAI